MKNLQLINKDVKKVTNTLNKLGVKYFFYAKLIGCYYIACLVNNDNMIRNFINYDGLKYEIALSPHKKLIMVYTQYLA